MSTVKWLTSSSVSLMLIIIVFIAVVTVVEGQNRLTGNTYIERQLLCALDRAPCDVLGKQIKDALPEIIGRQCQRCDQRQIANARRMAQFVQTKYPDVWEALKQKYSSG